MIIDIALIGLLIVRPSIGLAAWIAVLFALRHVPLLAGEVARMLGLDSYHGLTAVVAHLALPAWSHMSSDGEAGAQKTRAAVVVPVPNSLVPPPQTPIDRDISKEGWIVAMASARDENGGYVFSANQIDKAIGAHRATTLAKIREVRENAPPAQFRQDEGGTAPATYPITSK